MDVIMFIPNTLPILLHKKLGRGTQFKLSIPTLICVKPYAFTYGVLHIRSSDIDRTIMCHPR